MKSLWSRLDGRLWLAIIGTASILLITAYTLVQQSTRLNANDQPMVAAQAAKRQLDAGASPSDSVPADKINLKTDSGLFIIVTDNAEHVLASSGRIDGQDKLPPTGTFVYAQKNGSDHFTWQPQSGVRLATYMLPYGHSPNNGFVIAGQSLKQSEDKIGTYGWLCFAAWIAIAAWTTFVLLLPHTGNAAKSG